MGRKRRCRAVGEGMKEKVPCGGYGNMIRLGRKKKNKK
jgi:hypothetical protein